MGSAGFLEGARSADRLPARSSPSEATGSVPSPLALLPPRRPRRVPRDRVRSLGFASLVSPASVARAGSPGGEASEGSATVVGGGSPASVWLDGADFLLRPAPPRERRERFAPEAGASNGSGVRAGWSDASIALGGGDSAGDAPAGSAVSPGGRSVPSATSPEAAFFARDPDPRRPPRRRRGGDVSPDATGAPAPVATSSSDTTRTSTCVAVGAGGSATCPPASPTGVSVSVGVVFFFRRADFRLVPDFFVLSSVIRYHVSSVRRCAIEPPSDGFGD